MQKRVSYVVKPGDTLDSVAAEFGVLPVDIILENPTMAESFEDFGTVWTGQHITVVVDEVDADPDPAPIPEPPAPESSVYTVTEAQFHQIVLAPRVNWVEMTPALQNAMHTAELGTPLRACHFLAQILTETGGFQWFRELGPDSYFRKYEHRSDLGNIHPGDGLRFKGRGAIQITGRANYTKAGKALGVDLISHPEIVEQYEMGCLVAAWYWLDRKINVQADKDDVRAVTRLVNGGYNGLTDRMNWLEKAKKVLL